MNPVFANMCLTAAALGFVAFLFLPFIAIATVIISILALVALAYGITARLLNFEENLEHPIRYVRVINK